MAIVGNLDKVLLYVEDMEKIAGFYHDTLGLKLRMPKESAELKEARWVEFETGPASLCLHAGGKGLKGEDSPEFSFQVHDVTSTRAKLMKLEVEMDEIREVGGGYAICGGKDPEGNCFYISGRM